MTGTLPGRAITAAGAGSRSRSDRGSGFATRTICSGLLLVGLPDAQPDLASPVPHQLADAVGSGPVADLALLPRGRRPHGRQQPAARTTASTATLPAENYFDLAANWAITEKAAVTLGINNVLDDNPSLSGDGRHDRQRQHLPADLRRPRSLRLPAGDGGLLSPVPRSFASSTRGGLRAAAFLGTVPFSAAAVTLRKAFAEGDCPLLNVPVPSCLTRPAAGAACPAARDRAAAPPRPAGRRCSGRRRATSPRARRRRSRSRSDGCGRSAPGRARTRARPASATAGTRRLFA